MSSGETTPLQGIRYYCGPADWILEGLDGRVAIPVGTLPMPLLEEDFLLLQGEPPSYDAVGRGVYHTLRANPDCRFNERYVKILQEAYPHYLSEMASHIVMLDKKDVDLAYLDRKINYLKLFALMEPANCRFPLAIGQTYREKGLSLSALHLATLNLYRAERFLRTALKLAPADVEVRFELGEVCYLLGKYSDTAVLWNALVPELDGEQAKKLERRLALIAEGVLPKVPPLDYLEAVGGAFALRQQGEVEEAAAILVDVLDDPVFCEQFPLPEAHYTLGLCYLDMALPRYAEQCFRTALQLRGDFAEAAAALDALIA